LALLRRNLNVFGKRPLTPEERRLVLRSMAIIAVPLATITLLVGALALVLVSSSLRHQNIVNKDAISEAKAASRSAAQLALRLDEERVRRDNALAWQVYDNCVENENQDAANVALFKKVRALVKLGPATPERDALVDSLTDTILAREPPGEKDCQPPKGVRPAP
jgi:hypothetical protein